MEGRNVGIFGRYIWNLKEPSSYRRKEPRYATPEKKREINPFP